MPDKVQRWMPAQYMLKTEDGTTHFCVGCKPIVKMVDIDDGDYVLYSDLADLHASLIDLIDKTQSCTSGLSFGECLEDIRRRLEK